MHCCDRELTHITIPWTHDAQLLCMLAISSWLAGRLQSFTSFNCHRLCRVHCLSYLMRTMCLTAFDLCRRRWPLLALYASILWPLTSTGEYKLFNFETVWTKSFLVTNCWITNGDSDGGQECLVIYVVQWLTNHVVVRNKKKWKGILNCKYQSDKQTAGWNMARLSEFAQDRISSDNLWLSSQISYSHLTRESLTTAIVNIK